MTNRICLACGKSYEYCGSCPSSSNLPVWKNIFDTKNCKTVFMTVSDYAQNAITKNIAKDRLSKCDLSYIYKDDIEKYINDIITEEKTELPIEMETTEQVVHSKKNNKKKATEENND